MRNVTIAVLILLAPVLVFAAEISINLDRCAVLNHPTDQAAESKIALHFPIPDSLTGRRIYYVEMVIDVPVASQRANSLFELLFFPLMAAWGEDNIEFEGSEAITDTALVGSKMIKLGESSEFRIDMTPFVREVLAGNRANHGLIAQADLLGERNIRIPLNLGEHIKNAARVRIVYR